MQLFDLNRQSPAPGTTETPGISETPASTTTSETSETSSTSEAPATSEAVPATINATSTGEPVTEQAPTSTNTSTPTASEASTPEIAASETLASTATIDTDTTPDNTTPEIANSEAPTSATLPAGYLANGSMVDADGVMRSEYLDKYAQELAESLKPISASTFQRAFLTKAKEANKKKVPYSAKKNCAQGMVIAALKLVSRKKDPAPRVLLEMIQAATATVTDPATFDVLYMHLDAIYTNLLVG